MTRSELIAQISRKYPQMEDKQVEHVVRLILEEMARTLMNQDRIEIRGFGSFALHHRKARQARNPKTGSLVMTEEKSAVHFKPGKQMRDEINVSRSLYPIKESKTTL